MCISWARAKPRKKGKHKSQGFNSAFFFSLYHQLLIMYFMVQILSGLEKEPPMEKLPMLGRLLHHSHWESLTLFCIMIPLVSRTAPASHFSGIYTGAVNAHLWNWSRKTVLSLCDSLIVLMFIDSFSFSSTTQLSIFNCSCPLSGHLHCTSKDEKASHPSCKHYSPTANLNAACSVYKSTEMCCANPNTERGFSLTFKINVKV